MNLRAALISIIVLAIGLTLACGRATGVPDDASANAEGAQKLPFERESQSGGAVANLSPLHSVSRLPEGTPIRIRLLNPLSSGSAHAGDRFQGTLEDDVVIDGQAAVPRGSDVTGRVLAAKASGRPHDPGYLRIALLSMSIGGKVIPIDTSSLFVKGGSHEKHDRPQVAPGNAFLTQSNEVSFDAERRLTFRLAQAVELP